LLFSKHLTHWKNVYSGQHVTFFFFLAFSKWTLKLFWWISIQSVGVTFSYPKFFCFLKIIYLTKVCKQKIVFLLFFICHSYSCWINLLSGLRNWNGKELSYLQCVNKAPGVKHCLCSKMTCHFSLKNYIKSFSEIILRLLWNYLNKLWTKLKGVGFFIIYIRLNILLAIFMIKILLDE